MITEVTWSAFVPTAFTVSLLPGANQLLGFRNACRLGWAVAMRAVLGRLLAFTVMTMLVAVGLGALLTQHHGGLRRRALGRGGDLACLGVESWRQSRRPQVEQPLATAAAAPRLAW